MFVGVAILVFNAREWNWYRKSSVSGFNVSCHFCVLVPNRVTVLNNV